MQKCRADAPIVRFSRVVVLEENDLNVNDKSVKAREYLSSLFDENTFAEMQKYAGADGDTAGVITGYGTINGAAVYAFAQDISSKSGSINKAAVEKIKKMYTLALKSGAPVVAFYDSYGGDYNEGMQLLSDYADIVNCCAAHSGVAPQISVVTGTCAGITAILCCMSDFVIMTENSQLFINPPLDETAACGNAPVGGSAESSRLSGVAALVVKTDNDAVETTKRLISIFPKNNLDCAMDELWTENDAPITYKTKSKELVYALSGKNSVIELFSGFGNSSFTGFGSVRFQTVGFVAADNGDEQMDKDDCVKIAKLVNFCDAFSIPVVTIINNNGFKIKGESEISGGIRDAAKLAQIYASTTAPKICLATGKAIGAVFIGLGANADICVAYKNAVISPSIPAVAAALMNFSDKNNKKNIKEATEDYEKNETNPDKAVRIGLVDRIIEPQQAKQVLTEAVELLKNKRVQSPSRKHINFVF
jgi:acetyl-CoA carboxylase carboxyltransferase component